MKRAVMLTITVLLAAGSLSACGSSGTIASTSANNNNADPYAGWVMKFPDDGYTADLVFYRCDDKNTAYYRLYSNNSGLAVVLDSPDCTR